MQERRNWSYVFLALTHRSYLMMIHSPAEFHKRIPGFTLGGRYSRSCCQHPEAGWSAARRYILPRRQWIPVAHTLGNGVVLGYMELHPTSHFIFLVTRNRDVYHRFQNIKVASVLIPNGYSSSSYTGWIKDKNNKTKINSCEKYSMFHTICTWFCLV